jgi:hypothetical protein
MAIFEVAEDEIKRVSPTTFTTLNYTSELTSNGFCEIR